MPMFVSALSAGRAGEAWALIGVVLVTLGGARAQAPVAERADTLRVMSFNIRYGTARDGANHWDQRREIVAETIRLARPHVLGLQEALAFQVEYLRAELASELD